MLNDTQISWLWERMLSAETRSLYFGDLASRFTARKQWITGLSFFLSSGAAATVIAKSPAWVPVALSLIAAVATAYSIAVGLDRKSATMAKLHSSWNVIGIEYQRLWNHAFDEDAGERLETISKSEREASELATTEAPNNIKLLSQWQRRVFELNQVTPSATTG